MGEILRAVMDANCIFANEAFYTIPIPPDAVVGYHNMSASLQMKKNRFFMMTSVAVSIAELGLYNNDGGSNASEQLSILDANNGKTYYSTPLNCAMTGSGLNFPLTFPEYILFAPSQVITVNFFGLGLDGANPVKNYVTLIGIEYGKN